MKSPNTKSPSPKFNEGDIVQLISGGPKMAISSVLRDSFTEEFTGNYYCKWFAGNKLESANFNESTLVPWVDPTKVDNKK